MTLFCLPFDEKHSSKDPWSIFISKQTQRSANGWVILWDLFSWSYFNMLTTPWRGIINTEMVNGYLQYTETLNGLMHKEKWCLKGLMWQNWECWGDVDMYSKRHVIRVFLYNICSQIQVGPKCSRLRLLLHLVTMHLRLGVWFPWFPRFSIWCQDYYIDYCNIPAHSGYYN